MKKAKRILSFLMAVVMLSSVFSVATSALAPYKDGAITSYDDLDQPVFNTNQYASMVLDYVDVMLAEGNQVIDLSVLGELRLTSVDNALTDIYNLFNGATFTLFKWMLGDLGDLKHQMLKDRRRTSSPAATADLNVIYSLCEFVGDSNNAGIIAKAIDGSLKLGIASSFVDLSDLDVNHMIKEMLFGMAYPDTPVPAKPIPKTIDQMVQDVINGLIVGTPEKPGFAPGLDGYIDIVGTTAPAYTFIENLLANAYNVVVVPLLNTEFKKLVREVCGVVYDDAHPDGDESNLNEFAQILNINFVVPVHVFPAGATFVSELNNLFAELIGAITIGYTGWIPGGNDKALDNIANAVKYVLGLTGNAFFAEYIEVATPAEIAAMNNQELFSYLLRSVLNGSIDYMDIPADADTLVEVAWYGAKEACAHNIPANDYSAQPKTLDGVLFMLADILVSVINQNIDMNPGAGLLPYGQGFDATLTAVMNWVRVNYGGLFNLTLSSTNGWAALDTLVFSIIPANWLPVSVGGSTKELIVNRIMRDALELNTANLFALFDQRPDSELATKTIRKVLIDTVARLINVVFPGAAKMTYTSFEQMLSNAELKSVVQTLLGQLNTRKTAIIPAILPILGSAMGISVPQDFKNPDLALPRQLNAQTDFQIRNDSLGLNTAARNKNNVLTQDALYKIRIVSVTSSIPAITVNNLAGTVINGGDGVNCRLSGTFAAGQVLRVTMTYDVLTEDGSALTPQPLTTMAFSYIANPKSDDSENFIALNPNTTNKHSLRYKNIYINQNGSIAAMASNQVVVDREKTSILNHSQKATISRTAATIPAAFTAAGVTAAPFTNQETTYDGGSWTFPVFRVTPNENRPADGKTVINYTYRATATNSGGPVEDFPVPTSVILYDDFGLPGKISSALNANRDPNNYTGGAAGFEWQNYLDALNNAVAVAYRPKLTSNFMTIQVPSFEFAASNLDEAVEMLEDTALVTGVEPIKVALDAAQPSNEDLEFDDADYFYFGMQDYRPHTYKRFTNERDAARSLWNSQQAEDPEDRPRITPVDVLYKLHRFNLYTGRLVRVEATKARLSEDLARIQALGHTQGMYTAASWARYERALAFAVSVNAQSTTALDGNGDYILRQTKVNEARDRLIEANKKLVFVADYTQLLAYILEAGGLTAEDWTPESWAGLVDALTAAVDVPLNMLLNPANQAIIDAAAAALRAAIDALVEAVVGDPVFPHDGTDTIIDFIKGIISGIPEGANVLNFIDTLPGFYAQTVPTSNGAGTGTIINIFKSLTKSGEAKAPADELVASFKLVIYGDITGDGIIDSNDAGTAIDVENWLVDWDPVDDECYMIAGDLNGDGIVDSNDSGILTEVENWLMYIDQTTGRAYPY